MSCGGAGVVSLDASLDPCAPRLLNFTLGTRTKHLGYNGLPLHFTKWGPKHTAMYVSGLLSSAAFLNALLV